MRIMLITPPLTQLNTPYPATAYLKGLYVAQGHEVRQLDLGIEVADRVLSADFLSSIGLEREARLIEPVKRFLRGHDDTLAPRIAARTLLPEGPRFAQADDLEWPFGTAGTTDKARHLATLFIEDVADFVRNQVDPHFDLVRYAEHLSCDAPTFDPLYAELHTPPSAVDRILLALLEEEVRSFVPERVDITIPFPGCLYGALRCGQWLMQHTVARVELGGGFPNTEWRQLNEPRLYEFCHTVVIDGHPEAIDLCPDFSDLPFDKYLSLSEMTIPMHRLWSEGRWNKMVMAQGCYWHRCAFCDTTLPYIGRYRAPRATDVVDRMERIVSQTGRTGFHFVDEALPPNLLRQVADEIVARHLVVSWWGNIRFERTYTAELCQLLARSGCVAVSGGLEVASDRLLRLIDKGVTIQQTVDACRHLRQAGIMVHTYLMYGFPTETLQESVDALETVRQMFSQDLVQSAFWHRYAMTCHSPSGREPERFGARRTTLEPNPFCNNEVDWAPIDRADGEPQFDYDIDAVGSALRVATYNFMNGLGLERPVRSWFPIRVPNPSATPKKPHKSRR
ncbi:MAG: radical SAM protein [Bacteroidales bacterium]|nr:radical SAM protein [Bacteroidales bacterium]